jgi:hypothetical protein
MSNSAEMKDFMATIDSIQSRFMESLITGRRDAIFGQSAKRDDSQSEVDPGKACIDSQRGTF